MARDRKGTLKTVAWCIAVVLSVYYLATAFTTGNLVATAIAAALAFLVVKTSPMVPIPKIYRDQGITEAMFSGRRRPAPAHTADGADPEA